MKLVKKILVLLAALALIATAACAEDEKVLRFGQAPYGDTLDMQISTGSLSAAIADEVT